MDTSSGDGDGPQHRGTAVTATSNAHAQVAGSEILEKTTLRSLISIDQLYRENGPLSQLNHELYDKVPNSNLRHLQKNEILTLMLNEVAVLKGRGFFQHLRNRESWLKKPPVTICPESRASTAPGIVYMDIEWTSEAQSRFHGRSVRSKYLDSDALINTPNDSTPMYALQCVEHATFPIYVPSTPNIVVILTPEDYYLATSSDLEKSFGAWPRQKRKPRGPDPEKRLASISKLWTGTEEQQAAIKAERAMVEVTITEDIYKTVVEWCATGVIHPTFDAYHMLKSVPRPTQPSAGIALGVPFQTNAPLIGTGVEKSDPPSRRGGKKRSASAAE
ncbi:uncharacterized protein KY384_002679 [Bacidia gigantensis]|uniref:uncharacterized protein n=1 Tax=Bacidia gigantensis TaxID=2732470 RepID=UPI001D04E3D4|nr:uncharacterized protein KY384_002679 [Bacidia gigantensis]KAG8532801.1 hypothetical protein KY384_002679 [Bacidia gigantensis]